MPKLLSTLPLIFTLLFSTVLNAQEDTGASQETEAAQTEAEADTAADGGEATVAEELDLGQEVAEDPTYIKDTYGDWQLKCFRAEGDGEDICQMYQLLTEEAGNPVAEFSMFRLPDGAQAAAGATIVVPLGTLLGEELKISVDGGKAKSYPFSFCTLVGCFARIGFTENDVGALKRGAKAYLTIVPAQAPDQTVRIEASLSGFTAAYDNVSTISN